MSAFASLGLPPFATDVLEGLSTEEKHIAPRYLYDEIGASLFETITMLPEYGIARAEERLLRRHASELAQLIRPVSLVTELGSGSNRATAHILRSLFDRQADLQESAWRLPVRTLEQSRKGLSPITHEAFLYTDWLQRASEFLSDRPKNQPVFLMLLGSSAGSLDRTTLHIFLQNLQGMLKPGDHFLFAADLVKDVDRALAAYDDAAGVVAAFNRNLLGRINRELGGRFDLRCFDHYVKWDAFRRRVELHLRSTKSQEVYIGTLGRRFSFRTGETIQTESSCKFSELELEALAETTGFHSVKTWIDIEWAFAEVLWTV